MKPLTAAQREILDLIEQGFDEGRIPTLRELGALIGSTSTNNVHGHLRYIEKKGFIRVDATKSRGVRLVLPPPGFEASEQERALVLDLAALPADRVRSIVALAKLLRDAREVAA